MCLLLFLLSLVVYACLAKAFPAVPDPLNFDVSPSLRGFDISEDQIPHFPDFWPCVHEHGFRKVAIRGWQDKPPGQKDDNLVTSYNAAIRAGFTADYIDAYMFPCAGSGCSPIRQQMDQFIAVLDNNRIKVHTIWLDIECYSPCTNWVTDGSVVGEDKGGLARQWIDAVRNDMNKANSGRKWGIYTRTSSWVSVFGNADVAVAPELPLWVFQEDWPLDPYLSTFKPFGGWKFATAKQWYAETPSTGRIPAGTCGGRVDLDTFSFQQADIQIPSQKLGPQSCKTTVDGLRYRKCPHVSPNCVAVGQYPLGKVVAFTCRIDRDHINGDWSTSSWGRTTDGFYVSLAYVDQLCVDQLQWC